MTPGTCFEDQMVTDCSASGFKMAVYEFDDEETPCSGEPVDVFEHIHGECAFQYYEDKNDFEEYDDPEEAEKDVANYARFTMLSEDEL